MKGRIEWSWRTDRNGKDVMTMQSWIGKNTNAICDVVSENEA